MKKLLIVFVLTSLWACSNQGNQKEQSKEVAITESPKEKKRIVFFGNSLTAGYGVDPTEAYPSVIQQKLDSLGYSYEVLNAGVSGETTAGGLSKISWLLNQPAHILVIELGGNDGLRGIPVEETRKNLQGMIDSVRIKRPETKIVLAGMQIPPSMGKKYADEFARIYPKLASDNKIALIPFILEGVGGERELNQKDGIHPTAEGQRVMAENVWEILWPIIQLETE